MWWSVDAYPFVVDSVPDQYKTQKMSDKFVSKDPFVLEYCLDRYKTQEMCNKDVDLCLLALKLVPDWLVMKKKKKND